jgi:hypothetical protein
MIDFHNVWLPQIIGYAQLIGTGQLEAEWLGQAKRATSVTEPDELHMQVFEDLDADAIWNEWRQRDVISPDTPDAVDRFLQALREITENDARVLVLTAEWESVKDAARALLRTVPSSYKTDVSE